MSSWSQRRKLLYTTVALVIIVVPASFVAYHTFYKAPTCSDGLKNGDEQGVDCGGSCQKVCASAFAAPIWHWTRFEQVAPNVYNIATYIENPNATGGASKVPFRMIVYDNGGEAITALKGTLTLPPHRNTLAFVPGVRLNSTQHVKAVSFEFTGSPDWNKQTDPLVHLSIAGQHYAEDTSGSSLQVTLKNSDIAPIGRMSLYVVLYDKDNNAIGFSKTVVDGIPGSGTVTAPFTWPENFHGQVISQEILPVAE